MPSGPSAQQEHSLALHVVIVCLFTNLCAGAVPCRSPDGAVHLPYVAATALDVARAMAHLHQHNILHSDLKAGNVLLRTDGQDPRGFVAKVADFGLSLTIDPNCTHVSNAFQVRSESMFWSRMLTVGSTAKGGYYEPCLLLPVLATGGSTDM